MIPVAYVRQKQALGLGHAVLQAQDLVGQEPFAVMLGDDIVDSEEPCIGQMMRLFERRGNPGHRAPGGPARRDPPVRDRGREERSRTESWRSPTWSKSRRPRGALESRHHRPLHPSARDLRHPRARPNPTSAGEIQLTSALKTLLSRGPIDGYLFEGKRYDAGDKLGFLKATVEFALKRQDLGGPFREYLKKLKL